MIRERLELLERDKDVLIENLNITEGAIRDCLHWMSVMEAKKNKE